MRDYNPIPYAASMFDGTILKPLFAVLVAWAVSWWEGAPEAMRTGLVGAVVLVGMDTILGTLRAFVVQEEGYSSWKFGRVLVKVTVYLCSLLAAWAVDYALGLNAAAQLAVVVLVCLREVGSVTENSAALGFPWPEAICKRLEAIERALREGENGEKGGS